MGKKQGADMGKYGKCDILQTKSVVELIPTSGIAQNMICACVLLNTSAEIVK